MYNEIKPLFPQIKSCAFAISKVFGDQIKDSSEVRMIVFSVVPGSMSDTEQQKVKNWLKARLGKEHVNAYFVEDITVKSDSTLTSN